MILMSIYVKHKWEMIDVDLYQCIRCGLRVSSKEKRKGNLPNCSTSINQITSKLLKKKDKWGLGYPRKIPLKKMTLSDLEIFFDEYCQRKLISKETDRAKKIWWAMLYKWKEGGDWIEH